MTPYTHLPKWTSAKSKVVELRYFGGFTAEQTAEVLDVSVEVAKDEWSYAKMWLRRKLRGGPRT